MLLLGLHLPNIFFGIKGTEKGNECFEYPYDHLVTNIKSPTKRFGFIDPEGILNGSTTNERISIAMKTAKKIDLIFSRKEFEYQRININLYV